MTCASEVKAPISSRGMSRNAAAAHDMNATPNRIAVQPDRAALGGSPSADRMADPHGASRGDTKRHHERERGEVDRDLMRRQRRGRETSGQRRRRGKHADFERHLRRGRQSKREESAHRRQVKLIARRGCGRER